MTDTLHPCFYLSGQFEPDHITSILDIQPSWISRIGDPGPADALGSRRGAEWCWSPEDDDSNDVGDQLAFMAGALSSQKENVAQLSKSFGGKFLVHQQFNRDWFVSEHTLRLIADLNVCIECKRSNETVTVTQ